MIHIVRNIDYSPSVEILPPMSVSAPISSERDGRFFEYQERSSCQIGANNILVKMRNMEFYNIEGSDCFLKGWSSDASLYHYECDLPKDQGIKMILKGKKTNNQLIVHGNHTGHSHPSFGVISIKDGLHSALVCNPMPQELQGRGMGKIKLDVKIEPNKIQIQQVQHRKRRAKHNHIQTYR